MDIAKPIIYRGLDINSVALETGRVLRGIAVESVDYSTVEATGYTEKRAGSDGMHASDIYLGGRRVDIAGHIYAPSLAEMFDYLHVIRSVFSPTSAYQDDPGAKGFLPLNFQQTTLDVESFPLGDVPLFMNLRPMRPPSFTISRDRQDSSKRSNGERPTALPWNVTLLAKDPRVYVSPGQTVDIAGAPAANVAGTAINRGDYETPLNILIAVGAAPGAAGSFRVTGFNGIDMTITIENVANVVYRWFGDDRVLMTQDVTGGVTTRPLILRMDLVKFDTKQRQPMVPASINPPTRPFTTPFHYWKTGFTAGAGSRLFWSEAFA